MSAGKARAALALDLRQHFHVEPANALECTFPAQKHVIRAWLQTTGRLVSRLTAGGKEDDR